MPDRTPALPICRHCDGFPTVHITTDTRHPDGTRATLRAVCPACKGTGHTRPTAASAVVVRVGR
ncbi:hypothetical protein [Streptomyces montanisoli]|uniref:Uncharacterized protein n=1 Tax=Streptomyces montanisoli TaxID=2798581 RepID=A0A940MD67_9ACTN|nr:hypothetical protein [Streptomyces montanisoli]MBP0460829.1 hypothetical protein [Streptomyces montanisoli]